MFFRVKRTSLLRKCANDASLMALPRPSALLAATDIIEFGIEISKKLLSIGVTSGSTFPRYILDFLCWKNLVSFYFYIADNKAIEDTSRDMKCFTICAVL
jgi:hypothetical protein